MSNEAPVSTNVYLHSKKGASIQLTVRSGATKEEVQSVLDVLAHGIGYAAEKYKLTTEKQAVSASVPELPGNAPGYSGNLSFQAEELVKSVHEGKTYWKVKGHPFMKYGVTVWPEVLTETGFNIDQLTDNVYNLSGYTVQYVEKEPGKPNKVIKLVKADGATAQTPQPTPPAPQPEEPPQPPPF